MYENCSFGVIFEVHTAILIELHLVRCYAMSTFKWVVVLFILYRCESSAPVLINLWCLRGRCRGEYFGSKRDEVRELPGGSDIVRSVIVLLFMECRWDDQIKEADIGRTCCNP